ncbi:S-adenosyl-L-methionine-dependent methyltransferase, partial [Entophlyctis helioformis]
HGRTRTRHAHGIRTLRTLRKTTAAEQEPPAKPAHVPVLLAPVVDILSPYFDNTPLAGRQRLLCDATFGNGGYTKALLDAMDCKVLAVDQDPQAIDRARAMAQRPEYRDRLIPLQANFGDLARVVAEYTRSAEPCLDGIDGPLDMRMASRGNLDTSNNAPRSITAEAIVNSFSESELADIFSKYGEERRSKKVARAIADARGRAHIRSTVQLAQIRVFQALRIYVNDELGQLQRGLEAAERLLRPDGRVVVVTFHSLEDRLAKRFLKACVEGVHVDGLAPPTTIKQARRAAAAAAAADEADAEMQASDLAGGLFGDLDDVRSDGLRGNEMGLTGAHGRDPGLPGNPQPSHPWRRLRVDPVRLALSICYLLISRLHTAECRQTGC